MDEQVDVDMDASQCVQSHERNLVVHVGQRKSAQMDRSHTSLRVSLIFAPSWPSERLPSSQLSFDALFPSAGALPPFSPFLDLAGRSFHNGRELVRDERQREGKGALRYTRRLG